MRCTDATQRSVFVLMKPNLLLGERCMMGGKRALLAVAFVGVLAVLPVASRGIDECSSVGEPCCDTGSSLLCDAPDVACNPTSRLCEHCGDVGELCCSGIRDMSSPATDPPPGICNGGLSCGSSGRCSGAAPALSHVALAAVSFLLILSGAGLLRRRSVRSVGSGTYVPEV